MADKRNIVLITLDSVRADHCSFMGYHRKTTPTLDKMARKGLVFENAYAPSSRTLPSMVSLFTGETITKYTRCNSEEEFGKNGRLNLKRKTTLAEALSKKGYTTGAFNPNAYASRHFGFNKGFSYFQDFLFDEGMFSRYLKGGKLIRVIRNVKNLLEKKEVFRLWESYYDFILSWVKNAREPFFLWVFLLDTHFPYIVPRKHKQWGGYIEQFYYSFKLYKMISKPNINISRKEKRKIIDNYDDSIYYADKFIGRICRDLEDYDPLVIIHADHGEAFFERGFYGHFFPCMYEETIRVPLVVYNGDTKERVNKPVSLLDLYPALLCFAETGDLFSSLADKNWTISKEIDFRRGGKEMFSIRLGDWKFITGQKNEDELYYLKEDPNEQENLVDKYPELAKEMKKIIEKHIKLEIERKTIRDRIPKLRI